MKPSNIPYKNPNLITGNIDSNFYYVVNPFIKDGIKIINNNQYKIYNEIDGKKTVDQIAIITGFAKEDIFMVCNILEEKNYVNFTGVFVEPIYNKEIVSFDLWVHTTNDCNLRCPYCYIHTLGGQDYITGENIRVLCDKIVETVKRRQLKKVTLRLAGGEPLLKFYLWKSHLVELRQRLKDVSCKLRIAFLTNLTKLDDEIARFIKENNIGIAVSLDGIGQFHDDTRHFEDGKGSFSLIKQHINKLAENGISPGILTVVSNSNLDGLELLTQFVIDNNLHLRFSIVQGERIDSEELTYVLQQCYKKYEYAIEYGFAFSKLHKLHDLRLDSPFFHTCSGGFNSGALYTDGNIYFCQKHFGVEIPNGSIFEEDDILSVLQRRTFYEEVSYECKVCNLRYVCASGCPLERENGKYPHCKVYKYIIPIIYNLKAKERLRELKKKQK
ncbi:hypothetical protein FACS1894139_09820 [Planctomycetales bacterium]|nr:hypothetical protein FACS1894107_01880 [Planctomycetales bacterium]GHS97166.1 hypothetical protein FACS1894108_03070 [Planctomycetales bacterium]GHT05642.1 hypothetical protein FACS1894139_09820 [Planctomycetales bacterium]